MPNINAPFGFRPIIRSGGSPFSSKQYGKPATDPNVINRFDLVGKITGSAIPLPENSSYTLPSVQCGSQLTPGTSLWLGCSMSYGAPNTASIHDVNDEEDLIYIAQVSGTGAVTNANSSGLNANVLPTVSTLLTKMSVMQVNGGTIATTGSEDLRIRQVFASPPNAEGPNAIVEVSINKHALGQQTAGS